MADNHSTSPIAWLRAPVVFAALAFAYAAAAVLGLHWTAAGGAASPVWPAAGIALAGLLLGGVRLGFAVLLGAVLADSAMGYDRSFEVAVALGASKALAAAVSVWALRRWCRFESSLTRLRDVLSLIGVGAIGAAAAAATFGTAVLWATGSLAIEAAGAAWARWWLGDATGILTVTPFVLAWAKGEHLPRRLGWWLHLAACAACVVAIGWLVFIEDLAPLLRTWHVFPALIWAALAFGVRGASTALLPVSLLAVLAQLTPSNPFADISADPSLQIALMQQFIAVTSATMLLLAAIADERRGEAALAASEAHLRTSEALKSAILESALDCIITITEDGRIAEFNPAAERTFGYARDTVLGRQMAELIIPPEYRERHYRGLERYLTTGETSMLGRRLELEAQRADGSTFPVELAITATQIGGRLRFTAYVRDITARRRAVAALRESEARFRVMADSIPQLAWMAEPDGSIVWYNKRWHDYTGITVEQMRGGGWRKVHHPDHIERVVGRIRQSWTTGEPWEDTFPLRGKDGEYCWFLSRALPIHDAEGKVVRWFGTHTDVTEQRAAEERLKLLAAEVDHRSKNMLALVQAMVRMTRASDVPGLVQALTGRIDALARAHALLSESRWRGADLQRLVEEELAPFRAKRRIETSGPPIALTPRAAQSIAMAVHELATNAVKYGALSAPQGRVAVAWMWDAGGRLALRWSESGGPPAKPPARQGLGTGVIERAIAQQLDGAVRFDWRVEGLVCELAIPAASLVPAQSEAA